METIVLSSRTKLSAAAVATIGCFDGVHRGHQRVIRLVTEVARRKGLAAMVITFDRQPRELFDSSFRPQLLTTLTEKKVCLETLGVELLVVLPFTRELAALSAEAFMREVLHGQLCVQTLLTGYDNRFGHDSTEVFDDYVRYGKALGMEVMQGDVERMDGSVAVSSTIIRRMLTEEGRVEEMPEWLTRPYAITGRIVAGEHIGHELGFPTANLEPESTVKLIPANGVYAVWVQLDGADERMPAMMNIGMRPTFEGHQRTLEVHVLKEVGDIYGHSLTITFVNRLRAEQRFENREALMEQLKQDQIAAEAELRVKNWEFK